MADVLIHSPYPRQPSQGNAVTALRMTGLLRDCGWDVAVHERGDDAVPARCLIALNARKSAAEIAAFHHRQPNSPIIALLTGTDVNHPEMEVADSATREALELCTAIVSLHDGFSHRIPDHLLEKTTVIYPSVRLPETLSHSDQPSMDIVIAGNFRTEKNPTLMLEAVSALKQSNLQFHTYGAGGDFQNTLEQTDIDSPHFHFHGVQPHSVVLEKMQSARALLNTSTEEGGANAICEAVSMGLPVIASGIAGNIGMLGGTYAGMFKSNDLANLLEILTRCERELDFYSLLKKQVTKRAPLFDYEHEKQAWHALLKSTES